MIFKPSIYQQALFDWIEHGTGDAVVQAVAGSGKTTSAVKAMELIPTDQTVLFLAFNKSIAGELQERAPRHANVCTLNALGHRAWCSGRRVALDKDKTKKLLTREITEDEAEDLGFDEIMSEQEQRIYGNLVTKLVAIAKSQGMVPETIQGAKSLLLDNTDTWLDLMEHYDIDAGPEIIKFARRALVASCYFQNVIDFDDQLYLPVAFGVNPPRYDWVFVDEAQDLSPVQWRLVEMARKPGGRIVAVGDKNQAIYGWRGADNNSMNNFQARTDAIELPLSICYRCPRSHIRLAKGLVPQIECADSAPEGEILSLGMRWKGPDFRADDIIICRNSAPLVKAAYTILSQRVAVRILGRDLGAGLVKLIEKLKAHSAEDLIDRLTAWREKEIKRLHKKDPDATTEKIDDKFESIMTFVEMFPQKGPDGICREINNLYSNQEQGVLTLSTVHKAKGLEAHRVFILNRDLMPSRQAKKDWQINQENNLIYVSLTRAKQCLGFIEIETKRRWK